jgi:hypothetical protein
MERRCLSLEGKVASFARRMRCFLPSHTMAIPFLHSLDQRCRSSTGVRPAPLGSLVQRELAAVRLTEGLIRQNSPLHPVSATPLSRCNPSVKNQRFLPPPLTQGRHRRTAIFSPCGRSTVWRCLPLKGDGLKSPQQISRKRKTSLPERTNRQGHFHRRNGVGKRNYHVAWREFAWLPAHCKLRVRSRNSRLLSDSAHYIMPV